jgi:membrane protease YdiL (CAAX protease family)
MGRWKILDAVQESYTLQLGRYKLTLQEIIFLSFCAGVGEELLFRGMIQPWLGIFFTAFLFIGLHGYLNVKSSAHLVFGILLWGMGIVLGLLSANCGLLSAILAHMIYDIYAFMNIQKEYDNLKSKQFIRNIEDEQKEI